MNLVCLLPVLLDLVDGLLLEIPTSKQIGIQVCTCNKFCI